MQPRGRPTRQIQACAERTPGDTCFSAGQEPAAAILPRQRLCWRAHMPHMPHGRCPRDCCPLLSLSFDN